MSDPEISVMRIAGHRYHDTTTVYTTGSGAEVFHADKHCPHLKRATSEWSNTVYLTAHALPEVMSTWLDPIRPCSHCTQDIGTTAEIAVERDGLDPALLKYYEPGDAVVTRQVHTDPETGETTVREHRRAAYPGGDSP